MIWQIGRDTDRPASHIRKRFGVLLPLSSGPHEIRAVDGLRAFAALITVTYHVCLYLHFYGSPAGRALAPVVYFLQTGVHLFFVLSGFLLFLPYARSIIKQEPLPSTSRFYRRRALRILPAYWVCLTVLVLLGNAGYHGIRGVQDVVAHIFLLHDAFPPFNRDIEGPFWTLAVEAQFYVLLPLFAAGAAVLAKSAPKMEDRMWRLIIATAGILGLSLLLRLLDIAITGQLATLRDAVEGVEYVIVLLTMGTQGKYLEVFAVGMLCSVLYVATVEMGMIDRRHTRRLSWLALVGALVAATLVDQRIDMAVPLVYARGVNWDIVALGAPLLIGVAYGLMLLAVLWSDGLVRALFQLWPLHFIGLISYSLYLWHWPVIYARLPFVAHLPMAVRMVLVFFIAYASFQLVERPFLRRRNRASTASGHSQSNKHATPLPVPDMPTHHT